MSEDITRRFSHHSPKGEATIKAHERARLIIGHIATELDDTLPDGREKALAITKLEEALMWANAAIARA